MIAITSDIKSPSLLRHARVAYKFELVLPLEWIKDDWMVVVKSSLPMDYQAINKFLNVNLYSKSNTKTNQSIWKAYYCQLLKIARINNT
ncbi:hypothetical protein RhiirB3_458737 [Rhizophagus irregularis]|nr:hypothetical protein RhiirB3_458737 [Rhizophagus irregularis]